MSYIFLRKNKKWDEYVADSAHKTSFFFRAEEEKLSVTRKVLFRSSVSPITFELQAKVAFFKKFHIFTVLRRKQR